MKSAFLNKCSAYTVLGVFLSFAFSFPAFAGTSEVDDVLRNISTSSNSLPGLLTACCYMLGLLLGVTAVLKLKEHVDNPNQTPLRTPIIRLLIGGSLFALPMITRAVMNTIEPGVANFDPQTPMGGAVSAIMGGYAAPFASDFNTVLRSIRDSFADAPGFISAGTYMLGLMFSVTGLLKIKEHVERPEQTEMREGIIRLLCAGCMFAIPTIYEALYNAIGADGIAGDVSSILEVIGTFISFYDVTDGPCITKGATMGGAICRVIIHAGAFPTFLTALGYMMGLVLGVWGILKIKAHVLNPSQTPLHEGIMRLLAAGAFFGAPAIVEVMRATLGSGLLQVWATAQMTQTFNETDPGNCTGLDGVVYCFMNDTFAPLHVILNFFSICAGFVLIMIGISRLIKSAQEGARGPAGFGTFMTFAAGGALVSYNELMRAATATFFTSPLTDVNAALAYTTGMTGPEVEHAVTVISAILKFMIVVGLVSFLRGIFIIREVAEGNQQASMMAGITHMVGGALAVNLGPLINAVEETLGITAYGINFT